MIPLLIKEGSGVIDRHSDAGIHHPLPPPPPRRGVILKAVLPGIVGEKNKARLGSGPELKKKELR